MSSPNNQADPSRNDAQNIVAGPQSKAPGSKLKSGNGSGIIANPRASHKPISETVKWKESPGIRKTKKEKEAAIPLGHSQGLSNFLAFLSSAYESNDNGAIKNAQGNLLDALKIEKKIVKKRVEEKKDAEFVEDLASFGISES